MKGDKAFGKAVYLKQK